MKKKYTATWTIRFWTTVEAESEEEADDIVCGMRFDEWDGWETYPYADDRRIELDDEEDEG